MIKRVLTCLSLYAANDYVRDYIMPKTTKLLDFTEAMHYFFNKTGICPAYEALFQRFK